MLVSSDKATRTSSKCRELGKPGADVQREGILTCLYSFIRKYARESDIYPSRKSLDIISLAADLFAEWVR